MSTEPDHPFESIVSGTQSIGLSLWVSIMGWLYSDTESYASSRELVAVGKDKFLWQNRSRLSHKSKQRRSEIYHNSRSSAGFPFEERKAVHRQITPSFKLYPAFLRDTPAGRQWIAAELAFLRSDFQIISWRQTRETLEKWLSFSRRFLSAVVRMETCRNTVFSIDSRRSGGIKEKMHENTINQMSKA
jgi:hypothetical protein